MLSLVILANRAIENIPQRHQEILQTLFDLRINYEVAFVSTPNFTALEDVKKTVAYNEKHSLFLLSENTSKTAQIYFGLDNTKGENVLILDMDTNLDIVRLMLEKYKDGCENVYVKKKENAVFGFFEKIGYATYQLGLKMLRKLPDLCCESSAILLNAQSINAILSTPTIAKELLNTNITPNQKFSTIKTQKIHDTTINKKTNNHLFSLGILTLIFVVVTIGAMFFYPMFNEWIYSLWMFIAIILWLALSAVLCVLIAKQIYDARQGEKIPVDIDGVPMINICATYTHKELESEYPAVEEVLEEDKKEKQKSKKSTQKKTTKMKTETKPKTTTKKATKPSGKTKVKKEGKEK